MKENLPKNVIVIRSFFDWVQQNTMRACGCALVIFLLISICFIPYRVDIGQVGVVRRFGRFVGKATTPGLNFRIPWGIDDVTIVDAQKIYTIEIKAEKQEAQASGKEYFTGDKNLIELRCVLQYQIDDAPSYLFHAEKPELLVLDQLQESIVDICGTQDVDEILSTNKQNIQTALLASLQKEIASSKLGIKLLSVNLDWIMPPAESIAAFMDVVDAKEEMYEASELAQAHKLQVLAEANGKADRIVEMAKAETASRIYQAKAQAERFNLLYAQNKQFPDETKTTEYYKTINKLVSQAEVYVLRPKQGAQLEVNLLDQVYPPMLPQKKETSRKLKKKIKKQEGQGVEKSQYLLPESAYENSTDREPGAGMHQETIEEQHNLKIPSMPYQPSSKKEESNE